MEPCEGGKKPTLMHNPPHKCKFLRNLGRFAGLIRQAPSERRRKPKSRLALATLALLLSTCGDGLSQAHEESLHVVVRTTPGAWYFERDTTKGVDHDLLKLFAETSGVRLEISHVPNTAAALDALCRPQVQSRTRSRARSQAQLAIGLLTPPEGIGAEFHKGPRYGTLKQQLLRRFDQPNLSSATELVMKNVEIGAEPAQIETLHRVKQRNGDLTRWKIHEDLSPHDLIELTDRGFVEYTVADSHAITMTKRFYPRIKETFDLSAELALHWIFGECAAEPLVSSVKKFFAAVEADRTLARIFDRYYGHATQLNYPDKLTFMENVHRRLGRYKPLFAEAARETGFDWRLLAALAYQESRWDPNAHSPSGVKGLMMLTLETAKQVNVWDRNDPYQSIIGGARFLLDLKRRLPAGVADPDRTWFALAAYNAGLRHVEKAMKAARDKGRDPGLWVEVREFLRVPAGKRALNVPVTYVYNVRAYRDVLAWSDGALRFDVHGEAPKALPTPAPL